MPPIYLKNVAKSAQPTETIQPSKVLQSSEGKKKKHVMGIKISHENHGKRKKCIIPKCQKGL